MVSETILEGNGIRRSSTFLVSRDGGHVAFEMMPRYAVRGNAIMQVHSAQNSAPPGLIFLPEFLTDSEERDLLRFILTIDFHALHMHGVTAKRRLRQYGSHYAFESYQLTPADPIPPESQIYVGGLQPWVALMGRSGLKCW
jgi:hypothetical protein